MASYTCTFCNERLDAASPMAHRCWRKHQAEIAASYRVKPLCLKHPTTGAVCNCTALERYGSSGPLGREMSEADKEFLYDFMGKAGSNASKAADRMVMESTRTPLSEYTEADLQDELVKRGGSKYVTITADLFSELVGKRVQSNKAASKPALDDSAARKLMGKDYCADPESYRSDWDD